MNGVTRVVAQHESLANSRSLESLRLFEFVLQRLDGQRARRLADSVLITTAHAKFEDLWLFVAGPEESYVDLAGGTAEVRLIRTVVACNVPHYHAIAVSSNVRRFLR